MMAGEPPTSSQRNASGRAGWKRLGPVVMMRSRGRLRAGETVEIITPGAGGYGPPAERDPAAVESDLAYRSIDLTTTAARYPQSWK